MARLPGLVESNLDVGAVKSPWRFYSAFSRTSCSVVHEVEINLIHHVTRSVSGRQHSPARGGRTMTKLRWFSAFRNSRGLGRRTTANCRFLSNQSGTTAIEFAMIAVPFIGLIGAVFETGSVYFRTSQLQLATEVAGRSVLTRSLAAGMTYQDFVNRYVCTWQTTGLVNPGTLGKMFDCSKLLVSITAPTSWGATYDNSFYTSASLASAITLPAAQSVAVIRIAYPVSSVAAILTGGAFKGQTIAPLHAGQIQWSGNNNAWSYMIMGIYAFKVEP